MCGCIVPIKRVRILAVASPCLDPHRLRWGDERLRDWVPVFNPVVRRLSHHSAVGANAPEVVMRIRNRIRTRSEDRHTPHLVRTMSRPFGSRSPSPARTVLRSGSPLRFGEEPWPPEDACLGLRYPCAVHWWTELSPRSISVRLPPMHVTLLSLRDLQGPLRGVGDLFVLVKGRFRKLAWLVGSVRDSSCVLF